MSDIDLSQTVFIDFDAFLAMRRKGGLSRLPSYRDVLRLGIQAAPAVDYQNRYFISHRWESIDHPDPSGWQIWALHQFAVEQKEHKRTPCCFWYDYCCLPQGTRTPDEEKFFKRGLQQLNDLSVACETIALVSGVCDPLDDFLRQLKRGWILCEMMIAHRNSKWRWNFHQTDHEIFASAASRTRDQFSQKLEKFLNDAPIDDADQLLAWFAAHQVECTNGADLPFLADRIVQFSHEYHLDRKNPPPALVCGTTYPMTAAELHRYRINEKGISGYFPGYRFDCTYVADDEYRVTVTQETPK